MFTADNLLNYYSYISAAIAGIMQLIKLGESLYPSVYAALLIFRDNILNVVKNFPTSADSFKTLLDEITSTLMKLQEALEVCGYFSDDKRKELEASIAYSVNLILAADTELQNTGLPSATAPISINQAESETSTN